MGTFVTIGEGISSAASRHRVGSVGRIHSYVGRSRFSSTETMEGLYLKQEEEGRVVGRYQYVRPGFLQAVADSDSHWMDRPIEPNILRDNVDLFA